MSARSPDDDRVEGTERQPRAWTKYVPGLAALREYDRAWLGRDLLAGVSVAAVTIPVGMAYAQLIGLPPVTGLYAGMITPVAYFFFGSSRQLRETLAAIGLDHRIGEQHMVANIRAGFEAFCAERPSLKERS